MVRARPQVLVIDDWLPDPRIGAGAPRSLALVRAIVAAGARLTLFPTLAEPEQDIDAERLLSGGDVARGYGRDGLGRFLAEREGQFDVVLVARPHNMAIFRDVAGKSVLQETPIIYDAEAVFATREALRREILGEPWPQEQLKREIGNEIALTHGTRAVFAVNVEDAQLFSANGHPNVRLLRYAVAPRPTPADFEARRGFLF